MLRLNSSDSASRPWRDVIRPVNDREKEMVKSVQLVLRLEQTGEMDPSTVVKLRGLQKLFNLRVTGFIDEPTWNQINELRWIDEDINS